MSADLAAEPRRFPGWWVLIGAVLLPCLYLPTLATRFDFIDDGNLVYPAAPQPLDQRLGLVWTKIVANYEHLGPFRPVLWLHWEAEAELCAGNATHWRLVRLIWCGFATGALLWLMRELGVRPWAALAAAALAMWNPYRNEIWTSLTLSEGVAMPYALLGLVCAVRAGRSPHPWRWDVAGAACVLAALGCKNVFAALVPAQMLLRVAPDGTAWRGGWRQHGRRACLLALTLLLPIAHFVYFKLHWHPGQYVPTGPSLAQLGRLLSALRGAVSLDFMGVGLALAAAAVAWTLGWRCFWERYRGATVAGLALLVAGVGIYLPMEAVSGRYTMPAVWGLDLLIAALLSTLAAVPVVAWRRTAAAVFVLGLAAVAAAGIGKQEKFAARARLLWETLEYVERTAPPGARVAWLSGTGTADAHTLNIEEGIHFEWHLAARGRRDLHVILCDESGVPQTRCEVAGADAPPTLLLSGREMPPAAGWQPERAFEVSYWRGRREYHCSVWGRALSEGGTYAEATGGR